MNKKNSMPFRDQLLAQEKNDAKLKHKFKQEIKKMYTEKLKKGQRLAHVMVSILIAIFTLIFWVLAKIFEELQFEDKVAIIEPLRLASTWLMFLSIGLLLLCLWPAIIGKIGLRIYPKVVRLVSWVIILAVIIFSLLTVDIMDNHMDVDLSPSDVTYGVVTLLLILVIGVHLLLSVRIDKNDLNNKESLLELQCRLAELEEKIGQGEE